MKQRLSYFLCGLCGLLLMANANADWQQPELSYNLTRISKTVEAPDFELMNMDDETVRLRELRGKVVLVNFWATWCPPCIREMPSMERLHQKVDAADFKVLAINQMEDVDQVFAFTGQLADYPTFDLLFDSDSSVSQAYAVKGLPTTFLIDKQGKVRYRAIGGRIFDHEEVVAIINKLIEE